MAASGRWTVWPGGSAATSPRCSSRRWIVAPASMCARTTTSSMTSRGTRRRRSCLTTATVTTPWPGPPAWRGGEEVGGAAKARGRVVACAAMGILCMIINLLFIFVQVLD
ncbi:hypothetical protein BAE44_0023388 [Dichanthelium oligosanthes]|uniref:Uncharacterized protein n=1 Tax=Dichanthelium oligosanthes TaxID=888268 RepID=A0A1E5URT9_9POAL|nr:hypothetical protein BAE44_0023388 [Dichanthelium oligosanthes]